MTPYSPVNAPHFTPKAVFDRGSNATKAGRCNEDTYGIVYFFHLTEGDQVTRDLDGTELSGNLAAQQEALKGIGGLVADALARGDRDYRSTIQIDDAQGENVGTLNFACPVRIEAAGSLTDG